MDFFVDTADLDQIKEAYSWGIVDGVTTNPSLIKKAVAKLAETGSKAAIEDYIAEILRVAEGDPVSLEVIGTDEDSMYAQGMTLYERFNGVAGNVVVKIPVNPRLDESRKRSFDGLKAIKRLAEQGIPINTTLVFTPEQALLAAKAGASWVSPFAGRIDDEMRKMVKSDADKMSYWPMEGREGAEDEGIVSGVQLIEECVAILGIHDLDCRVLAASLRTARQVRECALSGAHVATAPFSVLEAMIEHGKTVEGMKAFTADVVPEYQALFE